MDRRQITAALVEEADRLLAQGMDHAVIVARLKITEYVVQVIGGDKLRVGRRQPPQHHPSAAVNPSRGVDAATIRMIRRMLAVGILNHREIAREAGVSDHLVGRVAAGQRLTLSTERLAVFKDLGEQFLPEPIRCSGCHALISIFPCRACRARRIFPKNSSGR
jgi:hypothetical protein